MMADYLDPTWLTCQTLIRLSEYPANSVCPSALQARERHCGGSARADPGTSGLSSSTRFLLSKSHTLMVGPVAEHNQYLLGERVTVFKYPVCPIWLVFSLQLVKFHTLTYLSHPADTMIGLALLGENLTVETQSWWPSSWIVYLHCARVFQSLIVLSLLADTIWRLSAENATESTSLVWSSNLLVVPM